MDSDNGDILVRTTRQSALGLCVLFLVPLIGWAIAQGGGGSSSEGSRRFARPSGIDPNTATWYELAQLPGIGETTAKHIVEYRSARIDEADGAVFRSAGDLDDVRGIGRRTVDRIAPFLVFPAASPPPQS